MISIWGWWTEGVTFREWDRQEKTGCFLCNLVNTGAQWTNKPNYKFANSFNLRDAKVENIFFSFSSKSHIRVNLRPGLVFAHFPQCISEPGKYRGPTGRVCITCFYCIKFWHMQVGCTSLSGYLRGISLTESVLESQHCIKETVSPVLEFKR